ncbi:YfiT family bacillithiol transferase [Paenibacillus allorhizosphaerae]|uniref:Putative metal-dependent hydrolase PAECIP111802_03656 n=1 Tax=Paenibacillus allorhizosphaerae TaxID=2849866 RepID=A0ABM8VJT6_9BACL|nr:bacillithiol transferase BstA [Paenibacillus allorhizosphaerae]CAG7646090.1 Putative metal-dependent hydrolase YfiT [Paenibacillus allorhizosphaerae]
MTDSLRYPIGRFVKPEKMDMAQVQGWIRDIEELPQRVRDALQTASAAQYDTPYRPGGWTVRQVVHHLVDSHMNSVIRFKLALTEDNPTIKPYREEAWAELPDTLYAPVELSLALLDVLHARWVLLLRALSEADLLRTFHHPDSGSVPLYENIGIYAWHGRHHLAHIRLITG